MSEMPKPTSPAGAQALPLPNAPERNVLSAAKGGGITFAGRLVEYASRFIIGILVARTLGSEQLGLYTLTLTAVLLAAGVIMMGLPSAMVRYIPMFFSKRDTEGVWGTLQVGIGIPAVLSALSGIGLFFLADPIANGVFHEADLAPLLRWFSLFVPVHALVDTLGSAMLGLQRVDYMAIIGNVAQPVSKLILLLVLVLANLNAAQVLIIHFASLAVACLTGFYLLNKQFPLQRPLRRTRRPIREMVRFGLPLHMEYLIGTFRGNIQTVLLGALNTIATVGIFTVASQVNLIGQMFHRSIVTASMPIVSDLYSRGEREHMGRFYQTMTKWTFSLNLPLFLITLLFAGPILSLFGSDFVEGALALTILAWGNLVNTGTGICGVIINMTGNTIFNVVNSVILLVITLGLNILLIPRWGVVGAATTTMLAAVGVNLLQVTEVYALFRLLPYNAGFLKPVAAGLFTLVVVGGARLLFHTDAQIGTVLTSIIALLGLYTGTILLLGLSEEDRLVLTRITRRVSAVLSR